MTFRFWKFREYLENNKNTSSKNQYQKSRSSKAFILLSYYLRIYVRHRFMTKNKNKELDYIRYIIIPVCHGLFFLLTSKNKLIGHIEIYSSCGRPVWNFLCIIWCSWHVLYHKNFCLLINTTPLYSIENIFIFTLYLYKYWI